MFKLDEMVEDADFVNDVVQEYLLKYPDADATAIEITFRLGAAFAAMRASTQRLLASLGHERAAGRMGVLRTLYFAPHRSMSQNEIGSHMNVTSGSITYIVDSLERDGLVNRSTHPTDRRVTSVELSDEGTVLVESVVPTLIDHFVSLSSGFTEHEKQTLCRLLVNYRQTAAAMYQKRSKAN